MRRSSFLAVVALVALPAFLLAPMAPMGGLIWPTPAAELQPPPSGLQQALFTLLGLVTSLAFGAAVAFLIFGLPVVRELAGSRPALGAAMHGATFWVLGNWWLHDSLHMVVGMSTQGLLALEYGFHVTLMIAGGVLAYGLTTLGRERSRLAPSSGTGREAVTT